MLNFRLFTTALVMVFLGHMARSQEVFINEIHYDNAGGDVGEAVEIAGPANTDLSGWSLTGYNGNGGSAYNTIPLAGLIPNQQNGFGTLSFDFTGLQNGAPDGIALVDNASNVIQFLSYEGSFEAIDGPAMGLSSTDIGVFEPGSADEGSSMQLLGNGTVYTDFNWFSGDLPSSFGQINTDQAFGEDFEVVVLINEVDADQTSTDDAEFIELFDGGFGNTPLDGQVIVLYNGSIDEVYNAIDLDGFSTDADGYFVIGSSNVPNVDLDVFTTNGIQNGADAVALYQGDAEDFLNGAPISLEGLIDALVYDTNEGDDAELLDLLNAGQEQINEDDNDTKDIHSMQRLPNGSGGLRNTVSYTTIPPTPGEENAEPLPVTFIHEVQGIGLSTPIEGQIVTIEGIVVGDFQETTQGFYVQEEDADADENELTSEGVFVFAPGQIDVSEGDLVRVEGEVDEFFDLTQIDNIVSIEILESDQELPALSDVTLPLPDGDFLERYEGMRVEFTQTLFVTNTFLLGRGGELGLSSGDRLFQPTHLVDPGAAANDQAMANELNQIIIDDASTDQNPDPTIFPTGGLSFENTVRGGEEVTNIKGVLTYAWSGFNFGGNSTNAYRVYVTEDPVFGDANPRPDSPEDVGGTFKIASFNVLNYFNGDGMGGGFPAPRGADSPEEFMRQRDKIINAIAEMDADVVGLIEIENDGFDASSAIADLVNGVNAQMGEGTYAFVDPGTDQVGSDEIAVGFIYKPSTTNLLGASAILDSSVDPTFNDDKNRAVLLQAFTEIASGNSVNIAVNHFKSKGSPCDDVGDPNAGDGQGNCNGVRTDAAVALANWMATDPTGSGSEYNMIIGDLNAYAKEDPITALKDAGYSDLIDDYIGQTGYTFQFSGQWGYLDYAMSNSALTEFITGTTAWHINADEPAVLDYNVEFKSEGQVESFYNPAPFRSSDHDPVIVGLALEPLTEPCSAEGGSILFENGSETQTICLGEGTELDVDLEGEGGDENILFQWVITDADLNILGLPDGPPFNFDDAGEGNCLIWHLAFDPENSNVLEIAESENPNAGDIEGCFDLSNSLTVVREDCVPSDCDDYEYYLADILEDGTTNIYEVDLSGSEAALTLKGTSEFEVHIALNEGDGMIYAVSKADGSYRTFDPETGVFGPVEMLDTEVSEIVGAAFNADGKLMILSQSENAIYSVDLDANEVTVFDSYSPSLGGDIDFGSDGALYLATREGFGTFYIAIPDEIAADILIGDAPQLVTGVADTEDENLIFSHRDATTLMVREYDGTPGTPYDVTLDGETFMTFNGDLASGCADNRMELDPCDEGGDCNAVTAVYVQGTLSGGGAIDPARANPNNSLGAPEGTDELVFTSLGFGGSLTFEFDGSVPNEDGDDITVVETTFSSPGCEDYPEFADVSVSVDGEDFFYIGTVCKSDNSVDISDAEVDFDCVNFVRVANNDGLSTQAGDGFDVDGIIAIHNCDSDDDGDGEEAAMIADESTNTLSSYPNPTNGPSQAVFVTGQTERATLEVYDMKGRLVEGLFSGIAEAGVEYRLDFDGLRLPNGVYMYRLTTDSETIVEKFMIAK